MAPAQRSFHCLGESGGQHDTNNIFQPKNYNCVTPAAIQVRTGSSVNESGNFPSARQQQQQQQQQHLKHNLTRSSSHPLMTKTVMDVDDPNKPMVSSDLKWMNAMMDDLDDNDEPLSFNFDRPGLREDIPLLEDLLFDVNEGKKTSTNRGNQRSHSEPTLSLLADVFDTIDNDFNQSMHVGLEALDGWASPSPPLFDNAAPPKNSNAGMDHAFGINFGMRPSRKRSSSEPFMMSDFMNDFKDLEPDSRVDDCTGHSNGVFRSATAPPEWGGFEEECERSAKRGSSFSMGQVVTSLEQYQHADGNFSFGHTPSTSSTSTMSANLPFAQQAGNTPILNDFTLALFAVQETQTTLRTLQPRIMQLENLAAMEEISIASKLTASSSQYILASDIPNVYACLNGAWEKIKKLEDLFRAIPVGHQQQPSQGQNLSELQMMLTHGSSEASSSGAMTNYSSPMGNPFPLCAPLPPLEPTGVTHDPFSQFVLAAAHENERVGQPTSEAVMPFTPSGKPIIVNTFSPLPMQECKEINTKAEAPSTNSSPSSLPSPAKTADLKDLPPPSNTDPGIIMKRLQALMERTQMSQKRLQVSAFGVFTINLIFHRANTLLSRSVMCYYNRNGTEEMDYLSLIPKRWSTPVDHGNSCKRVSS